MVLLLLVLACAVWRGCDKCVHVCIPMFCPGRYSDEHILKFFKDKLKSMPCQNQVSKKREFPLSLTGPPSMHMWSLCRGSSSMAFPRHMSKPKNCLHVSAHVCSLPSRPCAHVPTSVRYCTYIQLTKMGKRRRRRRAEMMCPHNTTML